MGTKKTATPKTKRFGRPPREGVEPMREKLQVVCTGEDMSAWTEHAEKLGLATGAWARMVLRGEMKRQAAVEQRRLSPVARKGA